MTDTPCVLLDIKGGLGYILGIRELPDDRDAFEGFFGRSKACWKLTHQRPYIFAFISTLRVFAFSVLLSQDSFFTLLSLLNQYCVCRKQKFPRYTIKGVKMSFALVFWKNFDKK